MTALLAEVLALTDAKSFDEHEQVKPELSRVFGDCKQVLWWEMYGMRHLFGLKRGGVAMCSRV